MLLQQRALCKVTFPGIWSNACCSHPLIDDESIHSAMRRKLHDELGIDSNLLTDSDFVFLGKMRYCATSKRDPYWGEHELDNIYALVKNVQLNPNAEEVADTCWVDMAELTGRLEKRPEAYTPWFKACVNDIFIKKSIWNNIEKSTLIKAIPETIVYENALD